MPEFTLAHWVLVVILAIALVTDLKWRKIYNWTLLPGVIFSLIYYGYTAGLPGMVDSGKGFLLGLALLIIPFALGGIGAGDVKLLGTVGALMGVKFILEAFLIIAIIGGVMAGGYLIYQGALFNTLKRVGIATFVSVSTKFKVNTLGNLEETRVNNTFPYGVAIVAGTFFLLMVR